MAKVTFKRYATDAEAQASNIVDGQFIITGEGTSYIDYGTNRVSTNGTLDNTMSDSSLNGVQNKVIKEYVDDGIQEAKDYTDDVVEGGTGYTKLIDGTLICYGRTSAITSPAGSGSNATINLPENFNDTNYVVTITTINGTSYWGNVQHSTSNYTTSSFRINTWNSGAGENTNQVFCYTAIGRWK